MKKKTKTCFSKFYPLRFLVDKSVPELNFRSFLFVLFLSSKLIHTNKTNKKKNTLIYNVYQHETELVSFVIIIFSLVCVSFLYQFRSFAQFFLIVEKTKHRGKKRKHITKDTNPFQDFLQTKQNKKLEEITNKNKYFLSNLRVKQHQKS